MVTVSAELGTADGEVADFDSPATVVFSSALLWSGLIVTVTVLGDSGWSPPDCTPPDCTPPVWAPPGRTVFVTVFVVAFFSEVVESGLPAPPPITVSIFAGASG